MSVWRPLVTPIGLGSLVTADLQPRKLQLDIPTGWGDVTEILLFVWAGINATSPNDLRFFDIWTENSQGTLKYRQKFFVYTNTEGLRGFNSENMWFPVFYASAARPAKLIVHVQQSAGSASTVNSASGIEIIGYRNRALPLHAEDI